MFLSYLELHNDEVAYKYFERIKNNKLENNILYKGIQLLRNLEKYKDASKLTLKQNSLDLNIDTINFFNWPNNNLNNYNKSYNIFKTNIKTKGHSIGYTIDDNKLIYSKPIKDEEHQTYLYDLFSVNKINDTTFEEEGNKIIKSDLKVFYRGSPIFSEDKNKIYFTSNSSEAIKYRESKIEKLKISEEGENILKIFEYNLKTDSISSLEINGNSYHTCFPFVLKDSVMFFASSMKNKDGKLDLFYITKNGTKWSKEAKELKGVNTFEDEVYPFIYGDNFYFSSKGREGYGGMDIYKGKLRKNEEGEFEVFEVINLLKPINSGKDDFAYYQFEESKGYLSSNREGVAGEDEVWFFNLNLLDSISGVVVDAKTGDPLNNVKYKLYVKNVNGGWELISEERLGGNGQYLSYVDPNKRYKLLFEKEAYSIETGHLPNDVDVEIRGDFKEYLEVIKLTPFNKVPSVYDVLTDEPISGAEIIVFRNDNEIYRTKTNENGEWDRDFEFDDVEINILKGGYEDLHIDDMDWDNPRARVYNSKLNPTHNKGDKMIINNIYFEFDSHKIRVVSYSILDNIVKYLNKYPEVRIELSAHTDCVGPNDYNNRLSKRRAKSCLNYLINQGIVKSRLVPKGYGESQPLHPCSEQRIDDDKALMNRRIEMIIL